VIGGGTGLTWTPGQPIPSPPDPRRSTASSSTSPACRRPATASRWPPTQYPATNNGNALSLTRLGDAARWSGLTDWPTAPPAGLSFNESFIAALADVGVRTQGAEPRPPSRRARRAGRVGACRQVAGVNLDEEAARLIQYQQSYQAAAKVLQIAQQVFSSLLDIAG
jgi:flagellar hook-associated protein 1 FlgK